MGLGEPDIDIDEVLDDLTDEDTDEQDSETGNEYGDYSKKELYREVETCGRLQLDDKKAAIMCPCKRKAMLTDETKSFMCGLRVEAHPDDVSKSVLMCTGPIIGVKRFGSGKEKWIPGNSPDPDCPYSPFRF